MSRNRDQSGLHRHEDSFCAISDLKLIGDVIQMIAHGELADL